MTNLFNNPYWHCKVVNNSTPPNKYGLEFYKGKMPNFNIEINSIKDPYCKYAIFVWAEKKYNEDYIVRCLINHHKVKVIHRNFKNNKDIKMIQSFCDFLNNSKPSLYQLQTKFEKVAYLSPILLKYLLYLYPFNPETKCSFGYARNLVYSFLREDVMSENFAESQNFCFENKIKQTVLFELYCKELHPYRYCNFYDENKTKDFELLIERSLMNRYG